MSKKIRKIVSLSSFALFLFLTGCGNNVSSDASSSQENSSVKTEWSIDWTWDGYEKAVATFTSLDDQSQTVEIEADITNEITTEPTCEEEGVRTYTATVEFEGETYTDVRYESIDPVDHDYGERGICSMCGDYLATEGLEYSYDESSETYTLMGIGEADPTTFNLRIPLTYDDGENGEHPVTSVYESAFQGNENIQSVTIPSNVTYICGYAFYGCTSISNVYYEGTISGWLHITFEENSSNPMYNGADLYLKGQLAEDLTINNRYIDNYALYGCTSLKNLTVDINVEKIGEVPFYGCTSLENVYYEGTAGEWASVYFDGRYSNPAYLGANLYFEGELAEYVTVEGVDTVSEFAFAGVKCLKYVKMSGNVKTIDRYAFIECPSLYEIDTGTGVTSIKTKAFMDCPALVYLTIGTEVNYIEPEICSGCSSLVWATFEDPDDWYVSKDQNATSGTIPNVSNPSNAAWFLTYTYLDHYWFKTESSGVGS